MHKLDIHKLADEAELNSFHYKLIGWVILILVLDGYDIAITGAALPAIMADLKIDSTQAGFLASASLVGMMFGTIRSSLDDGDRRRAVQSPAATAGFTRDPIVFAILRFLAGFGLGDCRF
jgi:AAHS family benzoate transporter-like MFS transporter